MKRLVIVPVLALAAWLANPMAEQNLAQQKAKGKGDGPGIRVELLRAFENADVQKDLKLSESQIKQVGELSAKQKDALNDLPFKKKKELTEANNKVIRELLNANQKKRLGQLELQAQGPRAFLDNTVGQDLGLSQEQTTKIREAFTEANKKYFKDGIDINDVELLRKITEMDKTLMTDIVKSLNNDQRKKWREMTGPAFEGTLYGAGLGGIFWSLPKKEK
jgi:hypothetical protein